MLIHRRAGSHFPACRQSDICLCWHTAFPYAGMVTSPMQAERSGLCLHTAHRNKCLTGRRRLRIRNLLALEGVGETRYICADGVFDLRCILQIMPVQARQYRPTEETWDTDTATP
ncbi:hypothetical protein VU04_02880 [Desulfobulbus sp. TB]|nr:hypothetical protein [Desulfobulbus sp. TB]